MYFLKVKNKKICALIVAICVSLAIQGTSSAASLTLNSGVDGFGTVLSPGTLDQFWDISTNGQDFSAAKVAYPGWYSAYLSGGQIAQDMATVANTAAWITTPDVISTWAHTNWGVYNTVYAKRTFDLSGYDIDTVAINGTWRVADFSWGIYINGSLVPGTNLGYTAYTFAQDQVFSLAAGSGLFTSGINTIELRGQSQQSYWDGFWISSMVSGQTNTAVPEPTTMLLLGLGLVGLAGVRKRLS